MTSRRKYFPGFIVFVTCLTWSFVSLVFLFNKYAAAWASDRQPTSGGSFFIGTYGEPSTLNPIISEGQEAVEIQFYVIEPLLWRNVETFEWQRALASKWSINKEGNEFDFFLRKEAMWSDGTPLTAHDVKFSFDVIFDDRWPAAHMRPYYEGIKHVQILGPHQVRFVAKDNYFRNFFSAAALPIVPKHIYGDPTKGPNRHRDIVGSGPYKFSSWMEGRQIVLEKNPLWWGKDDPLYKGYANPDEVVFRFIGNGTLATEMLLRGEIDYLPLDAHTFRHKTKGPEWGKSVFKVKARNLWPKGYTQLGLNLSSTLFRDREERLALAHLFNRDLIIEKMFYGHGLKATGPWYRQSDYADPTVAPIEFSAPKAMEILRRKGWRDSDGDQVLDRVIDGRKVDFRFTVLTADKGYLKFLVVAKEDAKTIGIDMHIKLVDWNVFAGLLEERNFQAYAGSWSQGIVEFDPWPTLHSANIRKGGLNYVGYKNPKVDALIEKARQTMERDKRLPLMREIYRLVAHDLPTIPLMNDDYFFYAYSERVGRPKDTFPYDLGLKYWWIKKEPGPRELAHE